MNRFFCAFCKSQRNAVLGRHISLLHIGGLFVLTMAAMYLLIGSWDPSSIFAYVVVLCIGEIFVQIKWRIAVVCPECGFDPVLYRKDHNLACERVKRHLKRRSSEPSVILKKPLNLPTILKKPGLKQPGGDMLQKDKTREKPKIMSRHI